MMIERFIIPDTGCSYTDAHSRETGGMVAYSNFADCSGDCVFMSNHDAIQWSYMLRIGIISDIATLTAYGYILINAALTGRNSGNYL